MSDTKSATAPVSAEDQLAAMIEALAGGAVSPRAIFELRQQLVAMDKQEDARKSAAALTMAQTIANEFAPAPFKSGAVGVQLSGRGDVTLPDGTVENWTVSVLVRKTSTIPARKEKNPVTVTKIAAKPEADETADVTP